TCSPGTRGRWGPGRGRTWPTSRAAPTPKGGFSSIASAPGSGDSRPHPGITVTAHTPRLASPGVPPYHYAQFPLRAYHRRRSFPGGPDVRSRGFVLILAAAVAGSLTVPRAALAVGPVGNEFQANTYYTDLQSTPSVAATRDGRFVVVWGSRGQDGSSYG